MKLSNAPPGCREIIRRSRSLPLLKELKTLIDGIEKIKPLPQSKLGKALTYARNQWHKMEVSILKAELEVDNNLIEKRDPSLKPRVLKKTTLFNGQRRSWKSSALFYTLIENCKVHDLTPNPTSSKSSKPCGIPR